MISQTWAVIITVIATSTMSSIIWVAVLRYLINATARLFIKKHRAELLEIKEEVEDLKEEHESFVDKAFEEIKADMEKLYRAEMESLKKELNDIYTKFEVKDAKELLDLDFAQRKYVWCGLRKLTPEELEEIRTKDFGDLSQREIGEIYGISHSRVGQIFQEARFNGKRK